MTKRKKYTSEFKREAVRLMESSEKPSSEVARERYLKLILMRSHKCVLHPSSLAKYAAAFFRMSRSSLTCSNSRLSRATSSPASLRLPGPPKAFTPRLPNCSFHL